MYEDDVGYDDVFDGLAASVFPDAGLELGGDVGLYALPGELSCECLFVSWSGDGYVPADGGGHASGDVNAVCVAAVKPFFGVSTHWSGEYL